MPRSLLAAALGVLLGASPALACGGMVSEDGSAELQGFEALLEHRDGQERLLVSVDYLTGADPTELGWVLPLPSAPEIAEADDGPIQAALRITQPPSEEEHVPELIPEGEDEELTAGGAPGVEVIGRETVGGLRFVTLGGEAAGDVRDWMREHGFVFHDRQEAAVQGYLDLGWVVVAAKVPRGGASDAALVPIELRFAAEEPVYPLALAGTEHRGVLPMTLFVLTPDRVASTTYPQRVIPPEDSVGVYSVHDRLDLVYASPLSISDAAELGTRPGTWLSRYEAHWPTQSLRDDLVFARSSDQSPINYRGILDDWETQRTWIYVQRVAYPILLLAAILGVVALIRRGRRGAPGA